MYQQTENNIKPRDLTALLRFLPCDKLHELNNRPRSLELIYARSYISETVQNNSHGTTDH